MERQVESIKRSLGQLSTDFRTKIDAINEALAKPPAGVASAVALALDDRLVQLKAEVLETVASRSDKDRKVVETVLGLRLNELVGKHVDMHADFRLRQLEERLSRLDERLSMMEAHNAARAAPVAEERAERPAPASSHDDMRQDMRQDMNLSQTSYPSSRIDLEALVPQMAVHKQPIARQRVRFSSRSSSPLNPAAQNAQSPDSHAVPTPSESSSAQCQALVLLQQMTAGAGEN